MGPKIYIVPLQPDHIKTNFYEFSEKMVSLSAAAKTKSSVLNNLELNRLKSSKYVDIVASKKSLITADWAFNIGRNY